VTPKFGAFVPQGWKLDLVGIADPAAQYEAMSRAAREAERAGLDSAWVYDHFHTVPTAEAEATFEAWTTMAALARDTSTIRLGQMCTCNSYRRPSLLAKMSSCVDAMSNGRLIVGIGAGWYQEEFEAYGYEFPETPTRLRMLGEAVQVLKAMWTQDRAGFQGTYYRLEGAINRPRPVQQPHPPLWIAGGGEKVTLHLVARYADGCNLGGDPATVRRKLEVLKRHCDELGRDYDRLTKSTCLEPLIVGNGAEVKRVVADTMRRTGETEASLRGPYTGPPEVVAARLRELVELGIDYFIAYLPNGVEEGAIERFAREVVPLVG
jgi:F420-dependent oxidoreductase-like protein